jgi:hypothetical protein
MRAAPATTPVDLTTLLREVGKKERTMGPFITAVVFALISLTVATSADAGRRPTIDSAGICFNAPGADQDCDGTLCTCCYDEGPDAGCWICNAFTPDDCVFDPKVSSIKDAVPKRPKLTISPDTLTTSPVLPTKPPMKGQDIKQK